MNVHEVGGTTGSVIRKGVICEMCHDDWAIEYYKKKYICERCLNPAPPVECYAEEAARYYFTRSPLGVMEL